jgi:hypothetical protein
MMRVTAMKLTGRRTSIVDVELLVDRASKVIQFYALTSAVKGCGRKMVDAVIRATPEDWHLAVVFHSSGGFWRKRTEENPRLVVF